MFFSLEICMVNSTSLRTLSPNKIKHSLQSFENLESAFLNIAIELKRINFLSRLH